MPDNGDDDNDDVMMMVMIGIQVIYTCLNHFATATCPVLLPPIYRPSVTSLNVPLAVT